MIDHALIEQEIEDGLRSATWRTQIASILKIAASSLIDEVVSDPDKMIEKWNRGKIEHEGEDLLQLDAMKELLDEFTDSFMFIAILQAQEKIGELRKSDRFYEIQKLTQKLHA